MPWWIYEIKKDYRYFFSKLFNYIKVSGWTLPEISNFELLAGYLSLHGSVSGPAYDAFKEKMRPHNNKEMVSTSYNKQMVTKTKS